MWRIPASTDSRSSSGSSRPASHWRPLTPNRSLHGGRPFSRRCSTAWISFFARDRERTSCSRRANRRRITRQRSSGIHTDSISPRESSTASVRASSRSVFALACTIPVSSGETTITRSTCGSSSLATSHALPVTSNATRSVLSRLAASVPIPSGVLATRPAERTTPSSQIATTQKSRCTSKPIARPAQPDTPTIHLPTRISCEGDAAGQRHRPIRAQTLNPGKSQGRPKEKPGLEAHRANRPAHQRSPRRPLSRINRTYERRRTDPPHNSFMPRNAERSVAAFILRRGAALLRAVARWIGGRRNGPVAADAARRRRPGGAAWTWTTGRPACMVCGEAE